MKFTKIPADAFQKLQLNAGVLLRDFDPATGTMKAEDLLGATSGGVSFEAVPSYSDFGEDIDNCPKNVLELKVLESWEVKMSGTFVSIDADTAKMLVGSGDSEAMADGVHKITPRNDLSLEDFETVWWVGDYSDENDDDTGGFVAIELMNSLSTGGMKTQSTDKGKGQFSFEFTGHYSMAEQDKVPYNVYVKGGTPSTDNPGTSGGEEGETGDESEVSTFGDEYDYE